MRDAELIKMFNRRALILLSGKLFLFSILAGRLYKLQIIDNKKYKKLSNNNSIRIKLLLPARGLILDRNGTELANNINTYGVYIIPEEISNNDLELNKVLENINKLIKLTDKDKSKLSKNLKREKSFTSILIKNNLTWDEMANIQSKNLDFPGVYINENKQRYYPFNEIASHVIGYVDNVSEQDLKEDSSPLLKEDNFKIGKSGIEKYKEQELRGEANKSLQIVNATGRIIDNINDKNIKAINGKNIELTIDKRLQEYAFNRIKEESASAVIMDIYTGEILMMISVPGYNPNIFLQKDTSNTELTDLFNNPKHPFLNKAIEGLYAPGSTFKPITGIAGLMDGKIKKSTKVFCSGHLNFAGSKYHCWKETGHGLMNLEQALSHSCDIYFYQLATKLSMDLIQDTAFKFGLGQYTGIELLNELQGQVPSYEWKKNYKSESWYTGDTITSAIGQGFILVSPLQLAVMTSRIANGGFAVVPRITKAEINNNKTFASLNIDQTYLDMIKKGMFLVVNERTGRTAYFNYKGSQMAGKTGTAQVKRITKQERLLGIPKQTDIPWHYRHHALFIGYAPVKNPRFAVSVVVEHGISGSETAAPIARDLMKKTIELYT